MKKRFERQEENIDRKFKYMNTVMEKNKELIMNAIKKEVEQTEGAKLARCRSNEDEFEDYMDELEDLVYDTQKMQGTPLDTGFQAAMGSDARPTPTRNGDKGESWVARSTTMKNSDTVWEKRDYYMQ
eukprot:7618209-Ditylum_brightwellii.AAC.1